MRAKTICTKTYAGVLYALETCKKDYVVESVDFDVTGSAGELPII